MSAANEQEDNKGRRNRSRQPDPSERPSASVNMEELRELIALMRENELVEFELENENLRVRLRRDSDQSHAVHHSAPPAPSPAPEPSPAHAPAHPGTQATTAASQDQDLHIIPSPIVGTFYRSPSPSADPFVKIGTSVEADTVVCIIEAMKLMNEIQAETIGEVAKIYVENGQPVEYGQPLFGVKPQ
ncbi:MAG TPA: acetyl-CoA carboxylase biotin carboxyl carrier protein [Pyrinomonadaceae bacterium]